MLRPVDARIVVQKPAREEQTAIGEVIAVGPGSRNMMSGEVMPMQIEVGETILYTKFGGTEVIHNGEEFILMAEKDVIAVIEEK